MQVSSMTVAERLAEHVAELRYEDVPAEVVQAIKDVLLHNLAVAIGGCREAESERAVAFATRGGASVGGVTIIGRADLASPIDAGFANAVMMRAWRQDDSMPPFGLHPGPIILPAALALGELRHTAGRDLITAISAGYDVLVAMAGNRWSYEITPRAPSHVYGPFATAATAARVLELDPTGLVTTLAYAGNLAVMISARFDNHNYGLVVRNGMTAAFLGEAGAPARADALEGSHGFFEMQVGSHDDRLEEHLDALGKRFTVLNTIFKPHPCTGVNLVPLTLVRRILASAGLTGRDVAAVAVQRARPLSLVGIDGPGPWPTVFRQISSVIYGIACVLVDGEVTRSRLLTLNDPVVMEACRQVQIIYHDDDCDRTHHRVTIRTVSGEIYEDEGNFTVIPKPDSSGILERAADRHLGAGRAAAILHAIEHLEELDSVAELTALLRPV